MSETLKYLHLTTPYCQGCGVDVGSGGVPVVPWAIQLDLPQEEFAHYNNGAVPATPIHLRGYATELPFKTGTLDFVYGSHILEDWSREARKNIIREWARVLKPSGKLIILVPDRERWAAAIKRGQPPNCAHIDEPGVGELTEDVAGMPLRVLEDRLTDLSPEDYSILFVAEKTLPVSDFFKAAALEQINPEWAEANPK